MGRHGSRADLSLYTIAVKPSRNSKGSLLDRRFGLADTIPRMPGRKSSSYVATKEQVVFS